MACDGDETLYNSVLHKITEALRHTERASSRDDPVHDRGCDVPMRLSGRPDTWVDVEWQPEAQTAILAFKGPGLDALDKERRIVGVHMEQPSFIKDIPSSGLTPPQVDGSFLFFFQALLEHSGDIAGLHGALLSKSGGSAPRRVLCTGHCSGGALAGIAAVWAGHTWPDADLRCITFAAPLVANAEFAEIFIWITGSSYAVVHDGDAVVLSAMFQMRGRIPLGHQIHLSDTYCATAKVYGVEARGCNHSLQVYRQATEHPCQGNITRMPMSSKTLNGLVSKHDRKELQDSWDSSKKRVEFLQGFSKSRRELQENKHHVCNVAKLKGPCQPAPPEAASVDGCTEASGDSAYERPHSIRYEEQGEAESHSSQLFREGNKAPDAAEMRAQGGDFRKVFLERRIRGASVAAHAVYHDEEYFKEVTGLSDVKYIYCKRTETLCALGWIPTGTLVIVWRGTANFRNVITDIKFFSHKVHFLPDAFPGAKAHTGFLEQLASVTDPEASTSEYNLVESISQVTSGVQPGRILCCGHSLGAAVAVLSAMWATVQYPAADVRCVGFAGPRVGNNALCKSANYLVGSSIRVEYGHDPIPGVPARGFGYDEYDYAVIIVHGRIQTGRRPLICRMFPLFKHHTMLTYLRQLQQVLPGRSGLMMWDDPSLKPQQPPTAIFERNGARCIC
ncbi:hypothetical protein CVIRNUC_008367 [Coccomyxa viridis]|uniref:Fungal lipase-type domain-containing protein n=1 Tax=Coccomyxa viridis TaxID=1274662 RepID=A0AAV1ICT2_9CHLO|nr:hypothetical protein CVIRNUC_008367 [Coccomyxa viridis]